MKTILISGARGYFGAIACAHFAARGWRVLHAGRHPGADVTFDLDEPDRLVASSCAEPVDVFLHAAAAHEVICANEPVKAARQNVAGTVAALEFAVARRVPTFVYISTFHVFGCPSGRLDEGTPPAPANLYGLSHLQAEEWVRLYETQGKLRGLVVRPSNFFGVPACMDSFNRWTLAPVDFVREAVRQGTITLRSPGWQRRNFVGVEALCGAIAQCLENVDTPRLLHIHGPETLTMRELAHRTAAAVSAATGAPVRVSHPEGAAGETAYEFVSRWPQGCVGVAGDYDSYVARFAQLLRTTF